MVYGAAIPVARAGKAGIRITAGYRDGSVLLEAVNYAHREAGAEALREAERACMDAGLRVAFPPHRTSNHPARLVYRDQVTP
jgi:hypothetical protein